MLKARILARVLPLIVLLAPGAAMAQYKNSSFGLDVGYVLFPTKPSIYASTGSYIDISSNRPDRLSYGYRFGGEYNFKLHADHWWFNARLDATFYQWGSPSGNDTFLNNYDNAAANNVGTVLGIDGMAGIRYFFLTDHARPYIELGLSLEHLFSFAANSGDTCDGNNDSGTSGLCDGSSSYADSFLPHTTFLGLHVRPGIEIIVVQDIAIHIDLDIQRWVIFNADDNTLLTLNLGMTFY